MRIGRPVRNDSIRFGDLPTGPEARSVLTLTLTPLRGEGITSGIDKIIRESSSKRRTRFSPSPPRPRRGQESNLSYPGHVLVIEDGKFEDDHDAIADQDARRESQGPPRRRAQKGKQTKASLASLPSVKKSSPQRRLTCSRTFFTSRSVIFCLAVSWLSPGRGVLRRATGNRPQRASMITPDLRRRTWLMKHACGRCNIPPITSSHSGEIRCIGAIPAT